MEGEWTGRQVGEALVAAFVALPHAPIYAPTRTTLVPALCPDGAMQPAEVLGLAARCLDRDERVELLTWARAKAARRLREEARERGRDRGSQRRRVAATLECLATALNAAEISAPKVPATRVAERR